MIICLHHGSSNNEINIRQSGKMTAFIKSSFPNEKVQECYYSNIVNAKLRKQGYSLQKLSNLVNENYEIENKIYIIMTNLIAGQHEKRLIDFINDKDIDNKIIVVKTLLQEKNLQELSNVLIDEVTNCNIIYVAHGMKNTMNKQYLKLEEELNLGLEIKKYFMCLIDGENKIENVEKKLNNKNVIIKPLMMIKAHHYIDDVEKNIIPYLKSKGYNVQEKGEGLLVNKEIQQMYVNHIAELVNK